MSLSTFRSDIVCGRVRVHPPPCVCEHHLPCRIAVYGHFGFDIAACVAAECGRRCLCAVYSSQCKVNILGNHVYIDAAALTSSILGNCK